MSQQYQKQKEKWKQQGSEELVKELKRDFENYGDLGEHATIPKVWLMERLQKRSQKTNSEVKSE